MERLSYRLWDMSGQQWDCITAALVAFEPCHAPGIIDGASTSPGDDPGSEDSGVARGQI